MLVCGRWPERTDGVLRRVGPPRVYCDVSEVMSRQCSADWVRTSVSLGLNRLGCVRVQTRVIDTVSRANKTIASRHRFIQPSHHTACSTTPMQGKTTEWFTCMGGADERRLLW